MNENIFSKKLKHALAGMNLSKLAKELSIPKSVLHDWIQAKRKPSLANMNHVKNLANYLGISFEELLLGQAENKQQHLTTVSFKDGDRKYSISITKIVD